MRCCGEDGAEVLATAALFLQAAVYACRQLPQIGYPGCVKLTAHERQFLALIAAAQADDAACFDAQLRWLARSDLCIPLRIAAHALGAALQAHGLALGFTTSVQLAR
jgi:GAF domain-containing protein